MLRINPLLNKELRVRMRSWRTFALLCIYLLGIGGLGLLFFSSQFRHLTYAGRAGDLSVVGQEMFVFLAILQFVMVFFAVPALTANSVSGERERQTFDLLVCTQLTPRSIVLGKLTAALSAVLLLVLATLPIYGFVFLLGGVSPEQLVKLFAIYLMTSIFAGSWSLLCSSIFKRTVTAIVASFALALFILGGTLLIAVLVTELLHRSGSDVPIHYLVALNPLALFEWLYPDFVGDAVREMSSHQYPFKASWFKFWHLSALVNLGISALCLWVSANKVNPLKAGRRTG